MIYPKALSAGVFTSQMEDDPWNEYQHLRLVDRVGFTQWHYVARKAVHSPDNSTRNANG